MTIYILEVPHQCPAKVWLAENEQDAINKVLATSDKFFDWCCLQGHVSPESDNFESMESDFDIVMDFNKHDLASQRIFKNREEVELAILGGEDFGHQRGVEKMLKKAIDLEE